MKIRKFFKYIIVFFSISFFIINWSEVSWIFNYRTTSNLFLGFFEKEDQKEYIYDNFSDELKEYERENIIEIPKIEIFAPLVIVENPNNEKVYKALDDGAVLFPKSALPGQAGQTIVLGHSSPLGWPKIKYDWIFTSLNELNKGDEIVIYFNGDKFSYVVFEKIFLEKGEEIPEYLTNSGSMLVLISCWPPGKDIRRIAVIAELDN